ncbi:nose resistant to fluoxetine protein 6-like [Elysia marginata]|uniref:Nose resistant to fluoxetine protein 6-like n=1 Tax=Elysia marginata TaxID=1093978 RepID=A0AAV4INQ8_9GAST|nr:nose resistant to fluoxetine protein 6-like [Elysia marginata]
MIHFHTENRSLGFLVKALVAFSVYTNGSKVLNTRQQPGSISCLHGIRFLSMAWVILGHLYLLPITFFDNLPTKLPDLLSRWSFDVVSNAFVSVDTFLAISGFLVSYLTVTEMKKKGGWRLNWGLFYFHRFWRLTPPYMLVIVLVLGLQQYCGQGALWPSVQPADKDNCEKYWWTNMFYLNNVVHKDKACLGQSWYLATDMQFFVLSPLLLIPFYIHPLLGLISCAIFFLPHAITTGVLTVQNDWSAAVIAEGQRENFQSYFENYYEAPWCRIGPYIVGIVTGYLLAAQRDRIKLNWFTASFGWLLATGVALAVIYGLRGDVGFEHPSSPGVAALYNAMARSAWAACVCWVIMACATGWGGFANSLLSWSPFVVLGRLTFMAYLIHVAIIDIYFGNQQTLYRVTDLNIALTYIGILVATYGVSFVLMLVLESPMIGLEKLFIPQRRND